MAKRRGTRRMRGGVWYNPLTWFTTAPEPAEAEPSSGSSLFGSTSTPTAPVSAPPPYGGKKTRRSKTRRGGRRQSKAKQIYGH